MSDSGAGDVLIIMVCPLERSTRRFHPVIMTKVNVILKPGSSSIVGVIGGPLAREPTGTASVIWGKTRAADLEKRIGVRLSLLSASDLMTIDRSEVESLAGTSPGRPQFWGTEMER